MRLETWDCKPSRSASGVAPTNGEYAAGVILWTYRGVAYIWHTGSHQGLVSALVVDPVHRMASTVSCNSPVVGGPALLAVHALEAWRGVPTT